MYSVTSAFAYNASLTNAAWRKRFYIGSSDYTDYVNKWPTIKKQWDGLSPQTVTIDLSNEGKTFNFLSVDPTLMQTTATLKLGFVYAVGSEEFITPFAGTMDTLRFQTGGCAITLIDKFRKLADRKIGDTTTPTLYTGSSYLIHDMAWYLCTSHGGLSAVASTSNPDIDYASFGSWTSVFSADNVRCAGKFTGQQPLELLKQLSTLTQSAIYVENDKLKFSRFLLTDSAIYTLNNNTTMDVSATMDDRELINKAWVSANFNITSDSFAITVYDISSTSVANYGLREKLFAEQTIWLTDSVSAINLAQRQTGSYREIRNKYQVNAPLHAVISTIGDAITFVDPLLEVSDTFRIMEEELDLDSGSKRFGIDQTQYFGGFILDVTSLDGSEVLT